MGGVVGDITEDRLLKGKEGALPKDVVFFSNQFVEWILTGKKTATTRIDGFVFDDGDVQRVGHLRPGDRVQAVDDDERCFGILEIVDAERRSLKTLDDDLARAENFTSAEELREVLAGFTPGLAEDDPLVVLFFKLHRAICN